MYREPSAKEPGYKHTECSEQIEELRSRKGRAALLILQDVAMADRMGGKYDWKL